MTLYCAYCVFRKRKIEFLLRYSLFCTLAHTGNEKLSLVQNHGNQKLSNLLTKKGPLHLFLDDSDNYDRFFYLCSFAITVRDLKLNSIRLRAGFSWRSWTIRNHLNFLSSTEHSGSPSCGLTPDFFPLMSLTRWALQTPLLQDDSQTPPCQATL